MALRRNIAGFLGKRGHVGAFNIFQPTNPVDTYTPQVNMDYTTSIRDQLNPVLIDQAIDQYWIEQTNRYDYALTHSLSQLNAEGIFVTSDNGSLFKDNIAWLPIQDVQKIENDRGTAGTLLMHLNEPALATDTAGYEGGGTGSGGSIAVTIPIPEVPTEAVTTPTTPTNPEFPAQPDTNGTLPVVPTTPLPAAGGQTDWLGVAALAGIAVTIVKGESLLGGSRKIALLGGLAALYYNLSKK